MKFFLNSSSRSHLRNLESEADGNKKVFRANTGHPLFSDIHNILLKTIGFDQIIDQEYLVRLVSKTEALIKRKIRYVIFGPEEFETYRKTVSNKDILLIWKREEGLGD